MSGTARTMKTTTTKAKKLTSNKETDEADCFLRLSYIASKRFTMPSSRDDKEPLSSSMNIYVNRCSEVLSMAAYCGDEQAVRQLLEDGADPNSTQLRSYLGLVVHEAVLAGHETIVRILIDNGASVEGTSVEGWKRRPYQPLLAASYQTCELDRAAMLTNPNRTQVWLKTI